ncbi:hypothetical protein BH23ACT9_BH23ACT9_14600 [soil metagenome]
MTVGTIFVDTNVVMYAVGRPHPHRVEVRTRLRSLPPGTLATSAEVSRNCCTPTYRSAGWTTSTPPCGWWATSPRCGR